MKKKMLVFPILVLAAAAVAQATPDPILRQLDYFEGAWRCSGTAFASPMAPEHATTGDVTMKTDLDGHWMTFTYAEKKTAANPRPFRVTGFLGYDPEIRKLVLGSVDNLGGYSTAASDGWDGDTLVLTGPWHMGGVTFTGRDTFRRKSAREVVHTAEIQQDGVWKKLSEETCTRKK